LIAEEPNKAPEIAAILRAEGFSVRVCPIFVSEAGLKRLRVRHRAVHSAGGGLAVGVTAECEHDVQSVAIRAAYIDRELLDSVGCVMPEGIEPLPHSKMGVEMHQVPSVFGQVGKALIQLGLGERLPVMHMLPGGLEAIPAVPVGLCFDESLGGQAG